MSDGWTIEIGEAGSGDLTEYPSAWPVRFEDRLNAPGFFEAMVSLEGLAEPSREDLVRFVYNKGEASEQTHFEGFITSKRKASTSNLFKIKGFSLDALLWFGGIGSVREYTSTTPHDIIQGSTSPNHLLLNSQGNLRSIGGTTLQYAADGTVPNQITSTNTGGFGTSGGSVTSGDFRAASDRQLVNIQRLCMQTRFDTSSVGLEYQSLLINGTGANEPTEPRFALMKRRERAASYTPEEFTIGTDFAPSKRGVDGVEAADLVKVIGEGSGTTGRIESSSSGTGDLEKIIADKTVLNATNAGNMAQRLQELLDPSTEIVTGWHYQHNTATRAGDDVVIKESGVADATLRCFSRVYDFRTKGFRLVLGRPRARYESSFWNIENLTGGHAHGPQKTDLKPTKTQSDGQLSTSGSGPGSDQSVADGDNATILSWSAPSQHADASGFMIIATVSANDGSSGDVTGHLEWDVALDGTDIMTFTTTRLSADVDYDHRATFPFGFGSAGTYTLQVTNRSGASVTIPTDGCDVQVTELPHHRMNV